MLPETGPLERFRSEGYKELEYDFVSTDSYRVSARRLNRIRHEENSAKATTVRNQSENEGIAIDKAKRAVYTEALKSSGFSEEGQKYEETEIDFTESLEKTVPLEEVAERAAEIGIENRPGQGIITSKYELPGETVNISIDEVVVKEQSGERPHPERPANSRKQVSNTVVQVQKKGMGNYVIVGETMAKAMQMLLGFLLYNN